MNYKKIISSLLVLIAFSLPVFASTYSELLQKKYSLTDAEVKSLNDSKISQPQQAMASKLARSSGKTVDEILKMRVTDKMGWGKIAKTLGVAPGELGKAVSEMNKERNAARKAELLEKNRVRKEKLDAEKKIREEQKEAKRAQKIKDDDNRLRPDDKAKPESEEHGKNN